MNADRLPLLALPIIGVMTGNAALSLDMYLPAFPAIAEDLGVAEGSVQVTMSTFLAGFALGQLFYGPISDALGRRKVIIAAMLVYGLVSAACAMSGSINDLILMRFFQGLAGAAGAVLGRAVIRDVYHGTRLAKAMSMLMLMLTAGPMAAPMIGSFVLDLWDWRAVFWSLAAYACLWSALILWLIPETLPEDHRISIHPASLASAYGSILSHRRAMAYALTSGIAFAGLFAYIAATPFIYMEIYAITPQQYALFFAANIASMAMCAALNGHFIGSYSADRMLSFFLTILIVSATTLLVASLTGFGGIWGLAVPLFFYIGSLNAVAANGLTGTMQFFGKSAGTASSVFGVIQFGGGSLAGWIIAIAYDGTPAPLGYFIMVCALVSTMVFLLWARRTAATREAEVSA